jgi:hypothetical protein
MDPRIEETMSVVRTFAACLIALSVALLPATLGAGRAVAATDAPMSMAMDDCCPTSEPCDKSVNDCAFMVACALKSFNFAAQDVAGTRLPLVQTLTLSPAASTDLPSYCGSPPLDPPRS